MKHLLLILPLWTFAQCPNDFCEGAIEVGCYPTSFDNYECTDEQLCVSPHPQSSGCSYGYQYNSQWFWWEVMEAGLYTVEISTNFISETSGWNLCSGMYEGSQWALSYNECTNWIVNSINFNQQQNCFCAGSPWPFGAGAWVGHCNLSPCGFQHPLGAFWWPYAHFPTDIGSIPPYLPYNPCRQYHYVEMYLPAGTYYLQLTSIGLSEGDGTIEVCGPFLPLSTGIELTRDGLQLNWTGHSHTPWTLFWADSATHWQEVATTAETTHIAEKSGYYVVAGSGGFSNIVHVEIVNINDTRGRYDVLGREGVKTWIK